jgi:hypothetical protein
VRIVENNTIMYTGNKSEVYAKEVDGDVGMPVIPGLRIGKKENVADEKQFTINGTKYRTLPAYKNDSDNYLSPKSDDSGIS